MLYEKTRAPLEAGNEEETPTTAGGMTVNFEKALYLVGIDRA